jgi:prophage DNA circulation protein
MTTWKDKLQEASFRGLVFQVASAEMSAGRRTADHEFPQRDINYVEDIGRATRVFSIEAFILANADNGFNYMPQRDALIKAIETKGSGELVHPYYGQKTVQISGLARITESNRDGGYCAITFQFSETQIPEYPKEKVDSQNNLLHAARAAMDKAVKNFEKIFSIFQKAQNVIDGVSATINFAVVSINTAKSYGKKSLSFQNAVNKLKQNVIAAALVPSGLAITFETLLAEDLSIFGIKENLTLKYFGADDTSIDENRQAFNKLIREFSVIGAVQAVSGVTFTNSDDAAEVRGQLITSMDELMEDADGETFEVYHALLAAMNEDFSTRAINLPNVISITLPAAAPSLFAAYDLYEDISKADEIASKNGVIHPGFLPSDINMEIVTRG